MYLIHKSRFFSIFFIILSTISLYAQQQTISDKKKYIFATDPTWAPMEFKDINGKYTGFDIEILTQIALYSNFTFSLIDIDWDGIFTGLSQKKYDGIISSVTITEERKNYMYFSNPYINAGQVFLVPIQNKSTFDRTNLIDMAIGGQIGTTGLFALKESGAKLIPYDELVVAVDDLRNNELDAVICDLPIASFYSICTPTYKGSFCIILPPFTTEYFGIVIAKGDDKLLELVNSGLAQIRKNGVYDQIFNKWFSQTVN
jgi:polar amino acid transport system substrate-binding protein